MLVREPAEVYDYINYVASREGVNVNMALAIAKAESGFRPEAQNPIGTASGVYQFLDSTFRNYCINKYHMAETMEQKDQPATQVNCAIEILKEPEGYKHWSASVKGWGHTLNI